MAAPAHRALRREGTGQLRTGQQGRLGLRFNINETVHVRLTDRGRAIHRQEFDDLSTQFPNCGLTYSPPREDADGWSEWQLWHLMEMFGPHIHLGGEQPFETNIVIPDLPEAADSPAIVGK